MVLEIFTHELSQRIALATKYTSLDSTLNGEVEVVWIRPGDSCHRSISDYVFILFMKCARMLYALGRTVSTSAVPNGIAATLCANASVVERLTTGRRKVSDTDEPTVYETRPDFRAAQ